MKKRFYPFVVLVLAVFAAACTRPALEEEPASKLVLHISLPGNSLSKTTLGTSVNNARKVYWSNGDQLALNGTASEPLSNVAPESKDASFSFPGTPETPYRLLYPASFYKDESTVTLPATQAYAAGTFATDTEPLSGYGTSGTEVTMAHLCAIVKLSVKKDAKVSGSSLASVTFQGNDGEQLTGDFTIDYQAATLTGVSSADADKILTMNLNQALSESDATEVFLVVPARTYASGFKVVMTDNQGRSMTKVKNGSAALAKGQLARMTEFTFVPSPDYTEFDIAEITEELLPPSGYNLTGWVRDNAGNPLEGVVVSDGVQSVRTMADGHFYMTSDIDNVKFVQISTPSGYLPAMRSDNAGIPQFYKLLSKATVTDGVYDIGKFVLTPIANPEHFTVLISADPQPRSNGWYLDKVAYKSLVVCEDLYQELRDVGASISDRQVIGICLGDLVHESMSLYANYANALKTMGFPTYNVIGNHDNNPDAADDDEGAATFESYFGPRNYSFNMGGVHFVVLDNLIMKPNPDSDNKLTSYDQGLTDRIWAWLQSDMAFVPTDTKIMVCAHSALFKLDSGSERTNTAKHGGHTSKVDGPAYGYGDLFDRYDEVHAWAGHSHNGFNFIYSSSHRHKNVQVHTLARSTGELWTNEYLANGTPRGFTVVEVDNGEITWKFHPVTRQTAVFQGYGLEDEGAPAYTWRDWDYNGQGTAVMKAGGSLTEEYQMHVYPRGSYGDENVYANVFLWDEKWENPVWTPDGGAPVTMTRLNLPGSPQIEDTDNIYDLADTEFRTWYKTYADGSGGSLKALEGYRTKASEGGALITTLFRAPAAASPSSGTVSVTDRFGNVYSRTVSW